MIKRSVVEREAAMPQRADPPRDVGVLGSSGCRRLGADPSEKAWTWSAMGRRSLAGSIYGLRATSARLLALANPA